MACIEVAYRCLPVVLVVLVALVDSILALDVRGNLDRSA